MSENTIIEHTFRTSADKLWEMWTTKAGFESWFAPEGFRVVVQLIEAIPDGKVEFDMIAESPDVVAVLTDLGFPLTHLEHCRFSIFRPCEQLEFRILMDFVPDVETYENIILVDFIPSGDKVRMVATLSPTHSEEHTRMCAETLGRQFANMEKQLNSATTS